MNAKDCEHGPTKDCGHEPIRRREISCSEEGNTRNGTKQDQANGFIRRMEHGF